MSLYSHEVFDFFSDWNPKKENTLRLEKLNSHRGFGVTPIAETWKNRQAIRSLEYFYNLEHSNLIFGNDQAGEYEDQFV